MKLKICALALCLLSLKSMAQNKEIELWPAGAIPNSIAGDVKEKAETGKDGIIRYSGVSVPTLTAVFPEPSKATGAAVMICPGGGYGILAFNHEGTEFAKWFADRGIAAFVLKYRLPNPAIMTRQYEVPLRDAMQGIKLIRENAAKWKVDPSKIGVMGFSAGGHLASTLSTHYYKGEHGSELAKPDFAILAYPVITFGEVNAHGGSRKNLLGTYTSAELIREFSNELQVNEKTPPTYLVHAQDDKAVPVENSLDYFLALKKANIPAEVHIYPQGGHGFGFRTAGKGAVEDWPQTLQNWLKSLGYVK